MSPCLNIFKVNRKIDVLDRWLSAIKIPFNLGIPVYPIQLGINFFCNSRHKTIELNITQHIIYNNNILLLIQKS